MDDFSLARPAGHLIMGDGSGPDGLAKKDGAKALSGAESVDTATTHLGKPSRTKNLITEFKVMPRYGPTPLVLRIIRRCTLRIYWTSSLIHLARDSLVPQALFPFAPGCTLP